MVTIERAVSIQPYFTIRPGQQEAALAMLREFIASTAREPKVLYYEFTRNGDQLFCREAYLDAAGLLEHLTNVGALLEKFLALAELTRLEIHGPTDELAKLKEPLAHLNPAWFEYVCGVGRGG